MDQDAEYSFFPREIKVAYEELWDVHSNGFTIRNMMDYAILAVKFAEDQPQHRSWIAKSIHEAVHDYYMYSEIVSGGDLYNHRYSRLLPEIGERAESLINPVGDKYVVNSDWVKLKWLIEDQIKIIS